MTWSRAQNRNGGGGGNARAVAALTLRYAQGYALSGHRGLRVEPRLENSSILSTINQMKIKNQPGGWFFIFIGGQEPCWDFHPVLNAY